MRVLIVEDNSALSEVVAKRLSESGFGPDLATNAEQAERASRTVKYAAIVLDLALPDQDGLVFLRNLRARNDATPVLIATARSALQDRVKGLREGADDYLAKPFALEELEARLHALLRRPTKFLGQALFVGNVSLDGESRQVNVGARILKMRLRETLVLEILMRHEGHVVPRSFFEDQLFGLQGEQGSNNMAIYIHRLRRHLEHAGATVKIRNIRNVGYMLFDEANAQLAA
jgi:DNA-binding response OmpR family regulator